MPPADDAALLLAIVQRHLKALELSLEPAFPEEDWGFTAEQAVEARDEEGPFPLPAPREQLLSRIETLLRACQAAIDTKSANQPPGQGST